MFYEHTQVPSSVYMKYSKPYKTMQLLDVHKTVNKTDIWKDKKSQETS